MIELSFSKEWIEWKAKRYKQELLSSGIKNVRIENEQLVLIYLYKAPFNVTVPTKVKLKIESSDDAQSVLIHTHVPAGIVSGPVSKLAAQAIAERIPLKDVTTNGGTVIVPLPRTIAGATVLLTNEHLCVRIRSQE